LNKPFSQDEYERKVSEIKKKMRETGEYGQHVPSSYRLEDTEAAQ
jgi:hypothetical protein